MDVLGRARSRAEFERFVAESSGTLVRTGYLLTSDLAEAEDLVQECLVLIARRWRRIRGMEHPQAYARTVLANLAIAGGEQRARRRQELHETMPETNDDSEALDVRIGRSQELFRALRALTPRQRTIVVLRYFEDLSEQEVAEALDCSLGTVKSTTSRALETLAARLPALRDPVISTFASSPSTIKESST